MSTITVPTSTPFAVLASFLLLSIPGCYPSAVTSSEEVSIVRRSDDVTPLEVVVQQQAQTIQTLQTKLEQVTSRLAAVEASSNKASHNQVAFNVHFSGGWESHQVGAGATLKFDAVAANVGNGYSRDTGVFTAPYSGTYLFLLGAMPGSSTAGELAIVMSGGQQLALTFGKQAQVSSGAGIDNLRDTTHAAVHLTAGQQVWVQHHFGSTTYSGYWATIFTGVLLQAD